MASLPNEAIAGYEVNVDDMFERTGFVVLDTSLGAEVVEPSDDEPQKNA